MKSSNLLNLFIGLVLTISSASCAATVKAEPLLNMVPNARLRPPARGENNIYIDFADQTGGEFEDEVYEGIIDAVTERGWTIVPWHEEAHYVLIAAIRVFNKSGSEEGDRELAALGGFASGVTVGALTYEKTGSWWKGAAAGGIAGGVTGAAINWATQKNFYQMVIDVELGRKVEGGVDTDLSSDNQTALISLGGAGTALGTEGAASEASTTTTQKTDEVRVHFERQQRILARAGGRRCTIEMAAEALIPKLINGIKSNVPRVPRVRP